MPTIRAFSTGTLLKIGFLGGGTFWLAVGLFFGIAALFGWMPVTLNDKETYGLGGLLGGILIGLGFGVLSAIIFMLGGLLARFVPGWNKIRVVVREETQPIGLSADS